MKKGSFGYIGFMKIKSAVTACIIFAAAACVYFTGVHFFPDNRTAVGIVTVLICIPAAMVLVRFIMFMRFKNGDSRIYEMVEDCRGSVPVFYDAIITTSDKSYGVNVFISSENSLLGYTDYPGCDIQKLETHLKDIYRANKYSDTNIKVFTDAEKFAERLKTLASRNEKPEEAGSEDPLLHLLGRITL